MSTFGPEDVSAVVCTLDSARSIRACLESLRREGVGEIVVVDGGSKDGTRTIAEELADTVLEDPGQGLGLARNLGIARTTRPLILNFGSDNVLPPGQLSVMIDALQCGSRAGVSAQTRIDGSGFAARGLNAWRAGRFPAGDASVIGTPTLFDGALLRSDPYDPDRVFSDDAELCERWTKKHGASFAISDALVREQSKATWREVRVRCRMYGHSDWENYSAGKASGWSIRRKLRSLAHPLRVDLVQPMSRLPLRQAVPAAPFLVAFTVLRYGGWLRTALHH